MSALSLEAILVRLVVHRVLLAIVAGVGVRATYAQRSMWPATLELTSLIAVDAVACVEAEREIKFNIIRLIFLEYLIIERG